MSTHKDLQRSPLHRPAFRRLWLGLVISRLGDQFTIIALVWFVLQLTGSALAIGLVVFCFQLPTIISSPLMGKLLDRYQPRTIMAVDNFGRACIIASIPLLYMLGVLHLSIVYALALFSGILSPATEVGCRIVIPRLVPDEELEKANSLSSISWDFATLVGPALAGVLVTVISAPAVLLLDAASFLLMGSMAISLPQMHNVLNVQSAVENRRSLLGFGTIFRMKALRFLTVLTLLFLFSQGLAEVAIPVYSQKTLGTGAVGYGLLMSAFGVGSLLSLSLISQFWSRKKRQLFSLAIILILSGLFLAPLVFLRMLPVAMLFMILAGFAAAPYYVVEQSLMQRLVPKNVQGQVFGARGALSIAGYPLGGVTGGMLMAAIAAPFVIGLSALLCIGMGCVCLVRSTNQSLLSYVKSHFLE
jgi:MFS family permease